jgi:tellurite resistance-related uncharacterized protein
MINDRIAPRPLRNSAAQPSHLREVAAQADIMLMTKWIIAVALVLSCGSWVYLSVFLLLPGQTVAILIGGGLFAFALGGGLFAAAFFSDNSGLDQRVGQAAHTNLLPGSSPTAIPQGLHFVTRTMDFTEATIPEPLLNNHAVKQGTWGLINVSEGCLLYEITDPRRERHSAILIAGGTVGVIEPTILHNVHPIGPVRFHLDFLREADFERRHH